MANNDMLKLIRKKRLIYTTIQTYNELKQVNIMALPFWCI